MSKEKSVVSDDANATAVSDSEHNPDEVNANEVVQEKNTVSRETYLRTLNQNKNMSLRLKQLEGKLSEKEQSDLKIHEENLMKSGQMQKVFQIKDEKIEALTKRAMEYESKYNQMQETLQAAAKTQAVLSKLPGQLLHRDYMAHIDSEKIVINPETNEIDEDSVDVVVNEFLKTHANLIKSDPKLLPNGNPKPTQKLSYEDWLKLPTVQEKLKRQKDVEGFKAFDKT